MCAANGHHRGIGLQLENLIGARNIITVSGAHKGVGKTALAELLLHNLRNFAAIKITITDDELIVTDDEQVIMSSSTDTCRMRDSGAVKVVWVRSPEHRLLDAMSAALAKMVPCSGMLIEGNSILKHLTPTLSFFVIKPPFGAMKPSRVHALKKADVCVINRMLGVNPGDDLMQQVMDFNPRLTFFSLNLLDPADTYNDDYDRLLELLRERIF